MQPYAVAGRSFARPIFPILTAPPLPPRTLLNSPLARVARAVLGARQVAMVLGSTVHLSGVSRAEFLADAEWVAHEETHLRQFREHGTLPFLWKYLLESARVGYFNNRFEIEAREEARRRTGGGRVGGSAVG